MSNSNPKLSDIPLVLQDLVFLFAFNMGKEETLCSLRTIWEIQQMKLPFFFFRTKIWSWHYKTFLENPCSCFMPIEYFNGRYNDIFDEDALYCFLLGLDFRRRNVKLFGSRRFWEKKLVKSWRSVEALSAYYKMLCRSKTKVFRKKDYFRNF